MYLFLNTFVFILNCICIAQEYKFVFKYIRENVHQVCSILFKTNFVITIASCVIMKFVSNI